MLATLVQSLLAAGFLIGIPLYSLVRRARGASSRLTLRTAAYFLGTGFGFVFLEIGAIQRLGLLLGHPIYATAAVLTALLAFSGLGSEISDRLDAGWAAHVCGAVAVIAAIAALAATGSNVLGGPSLGVRFGLGLLLVGMPGVLLGMPFPLGLRRLGGGPGSVGWAWAVDGVASVVGVSLATLLAMEFGGQAVLLLASVAYGVSAVATLGRSPLPVGTDP